MRFCPGALLFIIFYAFTFYWLRCWGEIQCCCFFFFLSVILGHFHWMLMYNCMWFLSLHLVLGLPLSPYSSLFLAYALYGTEIQGFLFSWVDHFTFCVSVIRDWFRIYSVSCDVVSDSIYSGPAHGLFREYFRNFIICILIQRKQNVFIFTVSLSKHFFNPILLFERRTMSSARVGSTIGFPPIMNVSNVSQISSVLTFLITFAANILNRYVRECKLYLNLIWAWNRFDVSPDKLASACCSSHSYSRIQLSGSYVQKTPYLVKYNSLNHIALLEIDIHVWCDSNSVTAFSSCLD